MDCCRKILQPPSVVKFTFLYSSRYLIYLNNKKHTVQNTDSEFISNVFIVRKDRLDTDENKFYLSVDILSPEKKNFPLKSYLPIYLLPFQTLTSTAKSSVVAMQR